MSQFRHMADAHAALQTQATAHRSRAPRRSFPALARHLFLMAVGAVILGSASAQTRISALEIGQLPQYCWASYDSKLEGVSGYSITNCGAGMNHFCSGLTYMLRANKPGLHRNTKIDQLVQARREITYTVQRVSPTCPILADVQMADQRLRVMEAAAGIKPAR
jgi:hypothetical protein